MPARGISAVPERTRSGCECECECEEEAEAEVASASAIGRWSGARWYICEGVFALVLLVSRGWKPHLRATSDRTTSGVVTGVKPWLSAMERP